MVLLVTFFLTVIFDLVIAIEIGIVLSSFIVMKRMSESISVHDATVFAGQNGEEKIFEEELPKIPKGILLYEINGPLFFGATQKFQETINDLHEIPRILILRMRYVPFIDATGIYRLKEVIRQFDNQKVSIILSGVNPEVKSDLEQSGIYSVLDGKNLLENIETSILRAREILGSK